MNFPTTFGRIPGSIRFLRTNFNILVRIHRRDLPEIVRQAMPTGTVKFFSSEKGYGFISRDEGEDVFVHFSNIEGDGYRNLEQGQEVEFEIGPGRKGDEALKVRAL